MAVQLPRVEREIDYEEAAREYQAGLTLENYMESTAQATQREITVESLALIKAQRADVHVFNELLVQYRVPRRKKLGQVVPDNMVVIHPGPVTAGNSYNVPLQPAKPFWVLEYVSPLNKRKDYVISRAKYERELKVRYYLLFEPEPKSKVMTLFRHTGTRYLRVRPSAAGRCEIGELELEVGLIDGWMRYWYRGKLLPLPAEILHDLKEERKARLAAEHEVAGLRAELARLKGPTKRSGPNGASS